VCDVDQAVVALHQAAKGKRLPTQAVGPVRASATWTAYFGTPSSLSHR
jgi:hypothetical protein